jgi:PKD repeat protein
VAGTGTPGFSGDGGQATAAQLNNPYSVDVDGRGNLYVADYDNDRVRMVANPAPTASFTATPASGRAPLRVSLDASASSDRNGSIASYAWAWPGRT